MNCTAIAAKDTKIYEYDSLINTKESQHTREISTIKQQLRDKSIEFDHSIIAQTKLTIKLATVEKQLQETKQQLLQLQQAKPTPNAEKAGASSTASSGDVSLESDKELIAQLRADIAALTAESTARQQLVDTRDSELVLLNAELTAKLDEIGILHIDNTAKLEEMTTLQNEFQQSIDDHKTALTRIQELESELVTTRAAATAATTKSTNNDETRLVELLQELDTLHGQFTAKQTECDTIQSKYDTLVKEHATAQSTLQQQKSTIENNEYAHNVSNACTISSYFETSVA
jgi:DNA repair exonuclease SbcCD ATPase subunit